MTTINDFGINVTPVNTGDTFFLDTNFIIASCDVNHKFHKSCSAYFVYLMFEDAKLYISEVVVMEVMNILAKGLYANDEFTIKHGIGASLSEGQKKNKLKGYMANFANLVKQPVNKSKVGYYNKKAWELFQEVYGDIEVIETNKQNTQEAIELSIHKNLLSADSLILLAAEKLNVNGLITLDGDIKADTTLSVQTTVVEYNNFDINIYSNLDYFEDLKEVVLAGYTIS
jgi:predicted nucleic acid-binding protein